MEDEFIGMIKLFVGNFAPVNFLLCQGQALQINQYQALYTIIGTQYGGDGRTTFNLPDLRGRMAIGAGNGPGLTPRIPAKSGGEETVTLTINTIPPHSHTYNALSGNREATSPANNYLGTAAGNFYSQLNPSDQLLPMNTGVIALSGGNQAHNNMPPFVTFNFVICANGAYPPRP